MPDYLAFIANRVASGEITAQEAGREYEVLFAESIGATPVHNSGAGFSKLDARGVGGSILWSVKWAGRHKSFRVEEAHFAEADAAINGPGGIGGEVIPGLAFTTESGEEFVTLRKADMMMLLHEGGTFASRDSVDTGTTPRRQLTVEERLA